MVTTTMSTMSHHVIPRPRQYCINVYRYIVSYRSGTYGKSHRARGARARGGRGPGRRAGPSRERAMLAAGLLLPAVYSVVPPPQTEPLLPRWTPTYNMSESTVVMPCNFSGTHSDAVRH